jgi:hypothetical protein
MRLRVGDRCGRFVLKKSLGRGGMAEVFLAEDTDTGGRYALKTVLDQSDAVLLLRFRREAEAQASADAHPNVLKIHSWHDDPRGSYVVMEYAQRGDLEERLRAGAMNPEEARHLVLNLALGLEHVHSAGVLHRDLKPGNVLFDEHGIAKLADFGLARVVDANSLTATGTLLGTPTYMSPEQARGEPLDARSDVYGLGAILYECLAGEPPFTGSSPLVILNSVVQDLPPRPGKRQPGIPGPLEAVCMRALAKDPDERYASAAALAEALSQSAEDVGAPTVPGWAWALAGISCLFLVAVALGPTGSDSAPPLPSPFPSPTLRVPGDAVGVKPPSLRDNGVLKYSPDLAKAHCPTLSGADEQAKLEVWRAVYAGGSWSLLGRHLDATRNSRVVGLEEDADQALYCYFKAWQEGDVSGMGLVGRRFIERGGENVALGFELGWAAGMLGDTDSQFLLAKVHGKQSLTFGPYRDWLAEGPISGAWLVLAREGGASWAESKDWQRDVGELPASTEEAIDALRRGRDGAAWKQDGLFDSAVEAVPSPREGVATLLRTQGKIEIDVLRKHLIKPAPTEFELTGLNDLRRTRGNMTWYHLGKELDPSRRSVRGEDFQAGMRKALLCYFEGIRRGDGRALSRLGRYLHSGEDLPKDAALGLKLLRWTAVGGSFDARRSLVRGLASTPREAAAWGFLLESREEPAGASSPTDAA